MHLYKYFSGEQVFARFLDNVWPARPAGRDSTAQKTNPDMKRSKMEDMKKRKMKDWKNEQMENGQNSKELQMIGLKNET